MYFCFSIGFIFVVVAVGFFFVTGAIARYNGIKIKQFRRKCYFGRRSRKYVASEYNFGAQI